MTKRFYSGARETSKLGSAATWKKLEIQKGGKLLMTSTERYKMILDKKIAEHHSKLDITKKNLSTIPGTQSSGRALSKRAEQALKEIAQKKAAKEAKAMRKRVVIQPRVFQGIGTLDAKGRGHDWGDNAVLKVNPKDGKIKTLSGWTVGKYKPKSLFTNMLISDTIKQHGPYHQRMRQMQLMEEQRRLMEMQQQNDSLGLAGQLKVMELYGYTATEHNEDRDTHGNPLGTTRLGANVTAWGVMSNNIHGTFSENVWGTMSDNIWGTTYSNVWGGLGGSPFGSRHARKLWGSGAVNQKNYLKPLKALFIGFLGFGVKWGRGRGSRGKISSRAK